MSIPPTILPIMGRISSLATAIRGKVPFEIIADAGLAAAKKAQGHPLWDTKIDADVHASLFSSAMKVAKGTYHLTYTKVPTPANLTKDENNAYWVKKECTPSSGMKSFLEGPTHTDCGGAAKALTIQAIKDVLGEEKFNALLSHSLIALNFTKSVTVVPNPLDFFTLPAHTHFHSADLSHITFGTRLYFQGIPWYGIKHSAGFGNGLWAFYLDNNPSGERLYWGLGLDKFVTKSELLENLLLQYNTPQSEESKELQQEFHSKEAFLNFMKEAQGSKLKGCDKEMSRCYDEPNIKMTMEEAKRAGLGFFGYATTERVSSTALKILQDSSLDFIQSPKTPVVLGVYHISCLLRQLHTNLPEDPNISKTTLQAQNFLKWVGGKS